MCALKYSPCSSHPRDQTASQIRWNPCSQMQIICVALNTKKRFFWLISRLCYIFNARNESSAHRPRCFPQLLCQLLPGLVRSNGASGQLNIEASRLGGRTFKLQKSRKMCAHSKPTTSHKPNSQCRESLMAFRLLCSFGNHFQLSRKFFPGWSNSTSTDSSLIAQGSLEASKAMWIGQTQLNYQEGVSCIASIGLNKLKK